MYIGFRVHPTAYACSKFVPSFSHFSCFCLLVLPDIRSPSGCLSMIESFSALSDFLSPMLSDCVCMCVCVRLLVVFLPSCLPSRLPSCCLGCWMVCPSSGCLFCSFVLGTCLLHFIATSGAFCHFLLLVSPDASFPFLSRAPRFGFCAVTLFCSRIAPCLAFVSHERLPCVSV